MYHLDDTICAIATAFGEAAIGVIRVSGAKSIDITNRIFRGKSLTEVSPNTIHFGKIVHPDASKVIDEVLISVFKAPKTYTGEDTTEISCHGSTHIQNEILQLLIEQGARQASKGEFTLRAYLNGKMDLSQAEAVADLISSKNEKSRELALSQMRGGYSKKIRELRDELINFASLIELELDFSEEDVEFADRKQLQQTIHNLKSVLSVLKKSFALGNAIKKGIPVAIVGEPNVGKSTLLNAILEDEKAIVTDIAGTTRDVIEDEVTIEGIGFRFIDTAGIRETKDQIEKIGIERTFQKLKEASIIIELLDGSKQHWKQQQGAIPMLPHQKKISVINKVDLATNKDLPQSNDSLLISAKQGFHLDLLKEKLVELSAVSEVQNNDIVISNARHFEAISKTLVSLEEVTQALQDEIPGDLMAVPLRRALHFLGEITGEITSDDLLNTIFSKFCIGK